MQKNIGESIKKNRIMKEYSQARLASEMGVAPSAVAFYETGKRVPKIEVREQIAQILRTDPVELSGLDLTEDDEVRLFNKLLVKFSKSMQIIQSDDSDAGCVSVILPSSYAALVEQYQNYQDSVREVQLTNSIVDEDDRTVDDLEKSSYIAEAKEELNFWLDTWPEYDYLYQIKQNNGEPLLGRHSLKERLYGKFLDKFYQFKENYKVKKSD